MRNSHSRTIIWFGSFFDCSAPPQKKRDLSEIAGWVGPTKKGMGVFGHCLGAWAELSKDWLPTDRRPLRSTSTLTAHFLYLCLPAACSSYESEIEQWGGYNSESTITVISF